jgi:hypothetical protein
VVLTFGFGATAHAGTTTNGIVANKLAANATVTNKIVANGIAANRVARRGVQPAIPAGDGAVADIVGANSRTEPSLPVGGCRRSPRPAGAAFL